MKLLLGSLHFALPGGAVTYLATIAEALQRLGHEITIHTPNPGMMADEARKGGRPTRSATATTRSWSSSR